MTNTDDAVPNRIGDRIDTLGAAMRAALVEAYADGLRDGMAGAAHAVQNARGDLLAAPLPDDVKQFLDVLMAGISETLQLSCHNIVAP